MNKNQQLNSIFERIVRDKNGTLVRVRFTVVNVNGNFQGQIVSIEPLVKKETLCLPCFKDNKVISSKISTVLKSIISSFVHLEFYMSQPTRAPAFAI